MVDEQVFDDELPKAAFQLDELAFEAFFKQNFIACCTFCSTKFGFDQELAKEVVHHSFVKLWENRNRLSNGLTLRSYMFKLVANSCIDLIRQEKTKQKHSKFFLATVTDSFEQPEMDSVDYKKLVTDIKNAIADLPEQMRTIFELSRNEGLKYAAIASQLDISIKTVETQMSRALVKLRQKLGHYLQLFIISFVLIKFF